MFARLIIIILLAFAIGELYGIETYVHYLASHAGYQDVQR